MSPVITFGTDGFRGIIADTFTFAAVERIAAALADYLCARVPGTPRVVIGYDRRFLSAEFAQSAASTLQRCGIDVVLSSAAVSTPAVSAFVRRQRLDAGVVITASHNPPAFNGMKIKDSNGASAPKQITEEIERLLRYPRQPQKKRSAGARAVVDIEKVYVRQLRRYINNALLKQAEFRIVVDAMHGVGAGIIEQVLAGSRCRVSGVRYEPDPLFGGVNPEPIAKNLAALTRFVRKNPCDVALAFDGDADRIGAMTPGGRFINSHYIICLLLLHLIEGRQWRGRVIKSINTTSMVDRIAAQYRLPLLEVPVGFKYIAEQMQAGDVLLGGEESGGIGFKHYMPERDGIVAGLLLLEMMAQRQRSLADCISAMDRRFGRCVYQRHDVALSGVAGNTVLPQPAMIAGQRVVDSKTYDGIKYILADGSWLIIRPSGTEPIVRIYAESPRPELTKQLLDIGYQLWTKR